MKMLQLLSKLKKEDVKKTIADYQQEALIQQGRDQFKKLIDRGLTIPVALL